MIQIYCGNGKGKTTAAMGLAIRSAGHGQRVVIAQFLKGSNSGERVILEAQPNIECLPVPETVKFTFEMNDVERAQFAQEMTNLFHRSAIAAQEADLLILDELNAAVSTGMVPLEDILFFLDHRPSALEIVITGRDPAQELISRADYITEMKKIKHPFDLNEPARKGIEW